MAKKRKPPVSRLSIGMGDVGPWTVNSKELAEDITNSARALNEGVVATQIKVQKRLIEAAANAEARRLMSFITRQMMKIMSKYSYSDSASFQSITTDDMIRMANSISQQRTGYASADKIRHPTGQLRWQNLGLSWLKKKGFSKPFFIGKTGGLRQEIMSLRSWPQTHLGGVKVTMKRRFKRTQRRMARRNDLKREFLIGELNVVIFPGATRSTMPGLGTDNWSTHAGSEMAPGLSPSAVKKLSGPTNSEIKNNRGRSLRKGRVSNDTRHGLFRPMLTPAAQFWATYRIPMAIRMASRKALSRKDKSMPFGKQD